VLRDGQRVFFLPPRWQVSTVLFDREGSLRLGTDADGLYRLKPALINNDSMGEGLPHQNVCATYVDQTGAVEIRSGIRRAGSLESAAGRVTLLASIRNPLPINSFVEEETGHVWTVAGEGTVGLKVGTPATLAYRSVAFPQVRAREGSC